MRIALALFVIFSALPALSLAPPAPSIYELEAKLEDARGAKVGLDLARGKPVVVSMFYGSCPHACPMLIQRIKKIDAMLSPQAKQQLQIVLVSLDPEVDEPARLNKLRKLHKLDERWHLTRTSEASMEEIAAVLGVKYRRAPNGAINHTTSITVLDENGAPVAVAEELSTPVEDVVAAIEKIAKRVPREPRAEKKP